MAVSLGTVFVLNSVALFSFRSSATLSPDAISIRIVVRPRHPRHQFGGRRTAKYGSQALMIGPRSSWPERLDCSP